MRVRFLLDCLTAGSEDCDILGVGQVRDPARLANLNLTVTRQHLVTSIAKQSGNRAHFAYLAHISGDH